MSSWRVEETPANSVARYLYVQLYTLSYLGLQLTSIPMPLEFNDSCVTFLFEGVQKLLKLDGPPSKSHGGEAVQMLALRLSVRSEQ